jgi:hypothetical protein
VKERATGFLNVFVFVRRCYEHKNAQKHTIPSGCLKSYVIIEANRIYLAFSGSNRMKVWPDSDKWNAIEDWKSVMTVTSFSKTVAMLAGTKGDM